MSLSITYVCSQILVIIYYLIYSSTFNLKDKSKILKIGILATIMSALSYLLLGAYTGVAMCVISIIRNIWFNKSKSKNSLIIVFIIMLIASIISYQDVFSLLSIVATMIYTYALWQKSTKKYKLFGIAVNLLMIGYDISIMSIMGVIFMIIAFISSIIGYIKDREGVDPNE